ncbi:MAG: hypothetical protein COV76_00175 [Candidatus Omnitrophica bacterium CG11_big_fil_rev_8_21_14_0_20_64_10]|nr:MAG: hypothetical protein COV76_00175 [Candidatus Omnitrophica bacterium CG11_big_fil_rev_8_21_14_0_20_64_10]
MLRRLLFAVVLAFLAVNGTGWAEHAGRRHAIGKSGKREAYLPHSAKKLARGVSNLGLCWTELLYQPGKAIHDNEPMIYGLGRGVGRTLLRAAQGAGEILTFPLPQARDGSQIAQDEPIEMWVRGE